MIKDDATVLYLCPWRDTTACPKSGSYKNSEGYVDIACHAGPLYFKGTMDSVCYLSIDDKFDELDKNTILAGLPSIFDWIGTDHSSHNEESE